MYVCMYACMSTCKKKFMVEYRISSPFFESLQVWGLLSDLIPDLECIYSIYYGPQQSTPLCTMVHNSPHPCVLWSTLTPVYYGPHSCVLWSTPLCTMVHTPVYYGPHTPVYYATHPCVLWSTPLCQGRRKVFLSGGVSL